MDKYNMMEHHMLKNYFCFSLGIKKYTCVTKENVSLVFQNQRP